MQVLHWEEKNHCFSKTTHSAVTIQKIKAVIIRKLTSDWILQFLPKMILHNLPIGSNRMFGLLSSPVMKLWTDERMAAWRFLTGGRHLTFPSSFITKETVNNHLAVDTIISASIIVWRVKAGNFRRCRREDGWGQERPRAPRGILNLICQLLPPQCHTAAPGAATFSVAFLSEGREGERAHYWM